jgi:hypothetical protein
MKTRPATTAFHAGLLAAGVTAFAGAQDIGYDALVARLGAANVPTGAGVRVAQVEAPENGTAANHGPDQSLAAFAGKSFSAMSGTPTVSGHATFVAQTWFGAGTSIAGGITQIHLYEANGFLQAGYLRLGAGTASLPLTPPGPSSADRVRIFNNSWIGELTGTNAPFNNEVLRRADYAMNRDGTLFVNGVNNGAGSALLPLMACGYNGIAVGLASGNHSAANTPAGVDVAGRMKPEIVAPGEFTSFSTPVVSAAAALLQQVANELPYSQNINRRTGVAVKSSLLCGATHGAAWSNGAPDTGPSRGITARPIDPVLGCGTVNIDRSHRITTSNEVIGQLNPANAVTGTAHPLVGWDYEVYSSPAFQRHYRIDLARRADASILVTWNRSPTSASLPASVTAAPGVANLRLELKRIVAGVATAITGDAAAGVYDAGNALSASAVDNVEHLYLRGLAAGSYLLSVTREDALSSVSNAAAVSWIFDEEPATTGDLNGDGSVDGIDLGILLGSWGGPAGPADLNGDGSVDGVDLGILLGNWG